MNASALSLIGALSSMAPMTLADRGAEAEVARALFARWRKRRPTPKGRRVGSRGSERGRRILARRG